MIVLNDFDDPQPVVLNIPGLVRTWPSDRRPVFQRFNEAVMAVANDYDIIGFGADDVRYETIAWDVNVAAALNKTGLAYGPDGIQNENLPTHPCFTSDIPRALGRIIVPGCRHYFWDNFMKALLGDLGLMHYLDHFVIEHLHHSVGAVYDDVYRENERHFEHDKQVFSAYVGSDTHKRDQAAMRLISTRFVNS